MKLKISTLKFNPMKVFSRLRNYFPEFDLFLDFIKEMEE